MNLFCIQSLLASLMPFDLGFVGIPAFGWMRDVVMWMRGVSLVGGARAVVGTPLFR